MTAILARPEIGTGLHIAVMVEPYLSAILDGRKTIESRFSVHRRAPYHAIEKGDLIIFKRSGGPVSAVAQAGQAKFFELADGKMEELRWRFAKDLYALDDAFWQARAGKRYATLIEVEDPAPVSPFTLAKRDRQGWVAMPAHSPGSLL